MLKRVLFLSGDEEYRKKILDIVKEFLQPDSNNVKSDILSIEDFKRHDMRAAYSDIKKRLKMALKTSREWIVIDVPADVPSAWQTYVNICIQDELINFYFYGFSHDQKIRPLKTGAFSYANYVLVDEGKCRDILTGLVYDP